MRVAFLLDQFPSPSETFVLDQIVGLIERGHDVIVVADRPPMNTVVHPKFFDYGLAERTLYTTPKAGGGKVQRAFLLLRDALKRSRSPKWRQQLYRASQPSRWPKGSWSRRRAYLALALTEYGHTLDLMYCHFGPSGLDALALREAGFISGKIVTVFHGYDITLYLKENGPHVYDALFERGEQFLPISQNWRRKLTDLGCPLDKITVHHMGVNVEALEFCPRNLPKTGSINLLSVARLVEKKGIRYALEAVARLLGDYPELHYTIVGDGPLKGSLEELAEQLNVTQNVTFLGVQAHPEVVAQMEQAHIFLLPSVTAESGDQEGIPVVLMEAMALGLPVVSTVHSGIPELIETCASGVLVPERSADELADGLRYLLQNPEVWQGLCHAARRQVEQKFNSKLLGDELSGLLGA